MAIDCIYNFAYQSKTDQLMKFNLSIRTLLTFSTGIALTVGTIVAPLNHFNRSAGVAIAGKKPAAPTAKPSSNMVYPPAGIKTKQGSNIEKAKEAMFRDGDYVRARQYLDSARKTEPNEPLVYAMSTLYPFSAGDLAQVKVYSEKTSQAGKRLMATNPLRGNLYQGVGGAIDTAYELKKNGPLGALNKLQVVFKYMDAAKKINPNDPELNLIKGYMDLLLAVNVPFSDSNQAIEQLKNSEPKYLAYRGIYIGYRDLKEYDKALNAINTAIKLAPNNPELTYYKAQILAVKGKENKSSGANDLRESIKLFESAYQKHDRLLTSTIVQILSERCQAKSALNKVSADGCYGYEEQLKRDNVNVVVGPSKLPGLN
jgi:tetratricopeptide (TPR) repeat protein